MRVNTLKAGERRQAEDRNSQIGVDVVAAHKRKHRPAGQALDRVYRRLPKDLLMGAAPVQNNLRLVT